MGKSQPYIHLKPSNLIGSRSRKITGNVVSSLQNNREPEGASSGNSHMLRINLNKFPSFIGHCSSRINRRYNEDAYSMNVLKLPKRVEEAACINSKNVKRKVQHWNTKLSLDKSVLNVSIFDGHGGSRVSKLLASDLDRWIANTYPSKKEFESVLKDYKRLVGGQYWSTIYEKRAKFYNKFIQTCNTKQEQVLQRGDQTSGSRIIFDKWGNVIDKTSLLDEYERLRIYLAFLKHDLEQVCGFNSTLKDGEEVEKLFSGGSTASSIFLTSYDEAYSYDESFFVNPESLLKLIVTQVGDTKVILCDKNGIAHRLVRVHHPNSSRESRRLGANFQTDSFGEVRFLNNFANTRAFGDRMGKREGLTCEPDIYSYVIGSTKHLPRSEHSKLQFGGDECFICLITDGVSDLMGDQEVVDLITSTVNNRGLKVASPQYCSEEVIRYIMAVAGRNADNATCLCVRLPNWGNWPVVDRTGAIREEKLMSSSSGSERSNV
ncbi:type 2C protein phosphatase PTC6 Ecym_2512 [Eremothecium cymbalariae DBVPG|uniref:PPM-type phosphatase domain-containing protein n=1 Tax=Eremothecium cymbalariae (strain CBS 270.75 / DBVPG 7215 / KCTC 17166 / NRRL Y-17582) TaxID=931890 RepID=G8JPX5_ERECY|nr:Hypothetical protein Ecym_2512 [Eremothecium cymbalariae DBVPG\